MSVCDGCGCPEWTHDADGCAACGCGRHVGHLHERRTQLGELVVDVAWSSLLMELLAEQLAELRAKRRRREAIAAAADAAVADLRASHPHALFPVTDAG